ncbi:MAG TPA: porin family protein [Edaphocola sp.]|nr:porin family protein [Edaphocola sp.]
MFKKLILSVAACAFFCATARAQKYVSLGPVAGFGHSGVSNGDLDHTMNVKSGFHPSFSVGLGLIYAKGPHWGFGGELLYAQEGYQKNFSDKNVSGLSFDETNNAGYIRLPLRVYYFFGQYRQKVRPKVYAGPSLGFNVGNKVKREADNGLMQMIADNAPVADFNAFDLGLQAGAGVNITLGKAIWLNLDLNYYQGFLDAVKDPEHVANFDDVKTGTNLNNHLRLQAGLLFGL